MKDKVLRDMARNALREHVDYEEGELLREGLHNLAIKGYKPLHSADEYVRFLKSNIDACTFDINHAQSQNHPYYLTFFSIKTQHIMGDCFEECLDIAMNKVQ